MVDGFKIRRFSAISQSYIRIVHCLLICHVFKSLKNQDCAGDLTCKVHVF